MVKLLNFYIGDKRYCKTQVIAMRIKASFWIYLWHNLIMWEILNIFTVYLHYTITQLHTGLISYSSRHHFCHEYALSTCEITGFDQITPVSTSSYVSSETVPTMIGWFIQNRPKKWVNVWLFQPRMTTRWLTTALEKTLLSWQAIRLVHHANFWEKKDLLLCFL